jgi:hypothetical protein
MPIPTPPMNRATESTVQPDFEEMDHMFILANALRKTNADPPTNTPVKKTNIGMRGS